MDPHVLLPPDLDAPNVTPPMYDIVLVIFVAAACDSILPNAADRLECREYYRTSQGIRK